MLFAEEVVSILVKSTFPLLSNSGGEILLVVVILSFYVSHFVVSISFERKSGVLV